MECCHVTRFVSLDNCISKNFPVLNGSTSKTTEELVKVWKCTDCNTDQSIWTCLQCGHISCGRYVAGHAKSHYEVNAPEHCVCLDLHSGAVFCYICDEFVINDTPDGSVGRIREEFWTRSNSSDNSLCPSRKRRLRRSAEDVITKQSKSAPRGRSRRATVQNGGRSQHIMSSRPKIPGLRNLGNTCFMNAVLQSLRNLSLMREYMLDLHSLEATNGTVKTSTRSQGLRQNTTLLCEEFRKVMVGLCQFSSTAVSPDSLFHAVWDVVPRFRGYQQQDAHEFLRYLLDTLHTELECLSPYPQTDELSLLKRRPTIVSTLFGGLLQSMVHCQTCKNTFSKHDPFWDLSLDIPERFQTKSSSDSQHKKRCNLTDCLSHFIESEPLLNTDQYYCSHCKSKQDSTKKFWIKRLPHVLCLHLKRFRWTATVRGKVDAHVGFPLSGLNMAPFVTDTCGTRRSGSSSSRYDLAAVVVHHGVGINSGHYSCYSQTETNKWCHINDTSVKYVSESDVTGCQAYLLFYVQSQLKRLKDLK